MIVVIGTRKNGALSKFGVTVYSKNGKTIYSDSSKSYEEKKNAKRALLAHHWASKRLAKVIGSDEVPVTAEDKLEIVLNKTMYLWLTGGKSGVNQEVLDQILYELSFIKTPVVLTLETAETKKTYPVRYTKEGLKAFTTHYEKATTLFQ